MLERCVGGSEQPRLGFWASVPARRAKHAEADAETIVFLASESAST
jgi:hypothetical protein